VGSLLKVVEHVVKRDVEQLLIIVVLLVVVKGPK
jgi:hypothetical protein